MCNVKEVENGTEWEKVVEKYACCVLLFMSLVQIKNHA